MTGWARMRASARRGLARAALPLLLAIAAFVLTVHNQHAIGIARDETVYFGAAKKYAAWWIDVATGESDRLSEKSITANFGGKGATDNNREHPPLMKTLFGLSERLFHKTLGVTDEITAFRLPTAALMALLVAVVSVMARALWGPAAGLLAGLLTLFTARGLFHAGLACFDAPIASLWFVCVYAYWRALERRPWSWVLALAFGAALATKHNALLLPFALGPHYLWLAWRRSRGDGAGERGAWAAVRGWARGVAQVRPSVMLAMALGGPLVLFALWPWLWLDPIGHVAAWLNFHLTHVHYNFEYLGQNWNSPPFPWHVPLVTTLVTVPVVTLAAGGLGTVVWAVRARRDEAPDAGRAPGLLLALSAAVAIGPFFLGSTPIFGAEKHWSVIVPSLAIAAAGGIVWAARQAAHTIIAWRPARWPRVVEVGAVVALGGAVVGAAARDTLQAQPAALAHYNALAGGAPGGAGLGMNRQFWGVTALAVTPLFRLAGATPLGGGPVYTHDAQPAWGYYVKQGLVARDQRDSGGEYSGGIDKSTWAIVVHEKHFLRHDLLIWNAYGTVAPVWVERVDGVPVVSVYRRPL